MLPISRLAHRLFIVGLLTFLVVITAAVWQLRQADYSPSNLPAYKFKQIAASDLDGKIPLQTAAEQFKPRRLENYDNLPLHFEPNLGQIDSRIKFTARGKSYNLSLSATGATFTVRRQSSLPKSAQERLQSEKQSSRTKQAVVQMQVVDADAAAQTIGVDELAGKSNYFIGSDPNKWRTDVPNYGRVHYSEVYRGIDLEYYGNNRQLEYDFIVKAGADPRSIRLRYNGVKNLRVDKEGELILETGLGEMRQKKPVIYQEENGARREIAGGYKIHGQETSFWLGEYDAKKTLVIDPVIVYATYHGGTGEDTGNAIAVDASGNAYIVGNTSGGFPVTTGQSYGGGTSDIFISKLNPSGNGFVYSTYLGGNQTDSGKGIAVDPQGNVYVTGQTNSNDFPRSPSPRQNSYGGGTGDAFVTKLNAAGNALVYSTFHGGSGTDDGTDIAVDSSGQVYLTGATSSDFPTFSARQFNYGGGTSDAFISKFNAAGNAFIFSTYHGGSQADFGRGIAIDSAANIFITGHTTSSNFPTSSPAQFANGGETDAFVTKFSADGQTLTYSTYHGGSLGDYGYDIAIDNSGSAFITGETASANFPISSSLSTFGGGGGDSFVSGFNSSGSRSYSKFLGGAGYEYGFGIAADRTGKVYVTGGTDSPDFPKVNAQQRTFGGGQDAYITIFYSNSGLFYSSYFGGAGSDGGQAIAVDAANNIYVAGVTASNNLSPTTAPQQNYGGGASDGFVLKFNTLAPTYVSVSGRVTNPNNEFLEGVYIRASGDDSAQTSSSSSDGTYTLNLPENGNYLISPIGVNNFLNNTFTIGLLNHTFTPTNYSITGLNSPQTGRDFTARANNDNFAQAVEITGDAGELDTSNFAATRETGEPDHGNRTIWYKWRATSPTRVNFRIPGNSFPLPRISIYTGSTLNNLTAVGTRNSENSVTLIPTINTEYKIAVAGGRESLKLKWGNFVTISGNAFDGFGSSIIIRAVSRTMPPVTYETSIPGFSGYYELYVPPGNTYDLTPVGVGWTPPTITLNDLTADSPGNYFQRLLTLARNVSGSTGVGTNETFAPTVIYNNTFGNNCSISSSGNEYRYTCPAFPNGTGITITAFHQNFTFSPNNVPIGLNNNVIYNFNAIRNNCTYSFNPTSPQNIPANGGDFNIDVTPSAGCSFTVRSDNPWITFNGLSGNTVLYRVEPNPGETVRNGSLTIGGITYSIVQAGVLPRLSIGDVYLAEGNNGTTNYNFTVNLSTSSTQTVSVNYSTISGTATVAEDFAPVTNQTIEFLPGQTSRQAAVQVNGDVSLEPNENFTVVLSNPQNALLGNATGIGAIENDDQNTFEGDVAVRPNGDGSILSNDVVQIRRFLNGTNTPDPAFNEFQRADSFPFAEKGDGVLNSADVVQTRRYQNGTSPLQTAGGPPTSVSRPEFLTGLKLFEQEEPQNEQQRQLRVQSITANSNSDAGAEEQEETVLVNIVVDAVGDEAEYAFTLNYDRSVLSMPVIEEGNTTATVRMCNTAVSGAISCSIGGFATNNALSEDGGIGEIASGGNQILITVRFRIRAKASSKESYLKLMKVSAASDSAQPLVPRVSNAVVKILGSEAEKAKATDYLQHTFLP